MASLFTAFRASALPKRLLRYALSRLELLDTDALDLENLDLALGRNTVLEFRDVGIKLQKLEKLLELPPTFTLERAKVLLLRVTIPVDFYTSPILAEVDGVEVRLKVSEKEAKRRTPKRQDGHSESLVVPTAADLAQSFLQTEPSVEKRRLEEALAQESQDLGASVAASEDGSEDDVSFGTGEALSLPVFLTDFLQGVVDRVQVQVRNVTFQVDVEVLLEPSAAAMDVVTFQLAVDDINIEGVTSNGQAVDDTPAIVPKDGKRHVRLNSLRASLISEANVFTTFSRSPSMPSSVASQSPVLTERNPPTRQTTATKDTPEEPLSNSDESLGREYLLQDSEDAFNIPYDLDTAVDEAEDDALASSLDTPRASMYQQVATQLHDPLARSAIESGPPPSWGSSERQIHSEPALHALERSTAEVHGQPSSSDSDQSDAMSESSAGPVDEDDLAKSQVFTHEEAESMYMSAFSQAQSMQMQSVMPGAWDSSTNSPESSPKISRATDDEFDLPPRHNKQEPEESTATADIDNAGERTAQVPLTPESQLLRPSTPDELATDTGANDNATGPDVEMQTPLGQVELGTPRGPTRLVKEIVSLQSVSLYLPSLHKHIDVAGLPDGLHQSASPNLPGTSSIHSKMPEGSRASPPAPAEGTKDVQDKTVEVVLAPMEVRFDASIGFLLATVVSKLLASLQPSNKDGPKMTNTNDTASKTPSIDFKLVAESVSLLFLDKLAGVTDTPKRGLQAVITPLDQEVLLKTQVENVRLESCNSHATSTTKIDVGTFTFGYSSDTILSFDQSLQMRASVRDMPPAAGVDVSIVYAQSHDATKIEVSTLPLHVRLDLQRLDETFSWFGGLSSFLNMGSSSMTSSASPTIKVAAKPAQKRRGVRFDAPLNPDDHSAPSKNKIDMRIGSVQVDLVGKECSMALETSAVKFISRDEGLGVGISKIRLSGPHLRKQKQAPAISAEVTGTRLEFRLEPKEKDLDRLLKLILPSKAKFDENNDEIMVDTLLRQRNKGSVLRLTHDAVDVKVGNLHQLKYLPELGEEVARLATVAKYLPEDDRPGILTLALLHSLELSIDVGGRFGVIKTQMVNFEVAHITVPSLIAIGVNSLSVHRNTIEELVGSHKYSAGGNREEGPVLMMRMIGDEIEPRIKVKMSDINIEYRVPTVMDVLGLTAEATPQDFEATLAASVANLGEQAHGAITGKPPKATSPDDTSNAGKPTLIDVSFRDCLVGLNPLGLTSKLTLVLTDLHVEAALPKDGDVRTTARLNKASVLLIDDVSLLESPEPTSASRRRPSASSSPQVNELCSKGFVNICYISSAKASVNVSTDPDEEKHVDIELRDDLLVLETCADSTQTLIALANALKPPTPPSKEIKFRTEVTPIQDIMASISTEAFGKAEGTYEFEEDFGNDLELHGDDDEQYDEGSSTSTPLQIESQFYDEHDLDVAEELFDATSSSLISDHTNVQDTTDGVLLTNMNTEDAGSLLLDDDDDDLAVQENYFGTESVLEGTAHRWNSKAGAYDRSNDKKVHQSPLKVCVRDVHVIWNLFDGYDWTSTRDVITKAVQDVETKAYERRTRNERRANFEQDLEEEEAVVGDFLFNSIYIDIPANRDPRELANAINAQLNDATETESVATTAITTTTRTGATSRPKPKRLKLNRSKHHKISFELKGVNADIVTFPPGSGETQSSIDVRVKDLDIYDHVPSSTWRKFATYDRDAGEREMGASMVHLELLNVRPVDELAATDMILNAKILPLRLHVDQDALDFITRFFEFKDESVPIHASESDIPFIQRAEIHSIPVKLDFKPKRVDYAGLRSGHTTEFMNFLILEDARLVLKHAILYGVQGFDRLGKTLNDIWTPDVKRHQLPGILSGLAAVKPFVSVGSGFRDLIEVPIKEYRKDGRVVRSLGRGVYAFASKTGTELVRFGAKAAVGTQYVLQGAEGLLVKPPPTAEAISSGWDEEDDVEPEEKKISLYADQPTGVVQGLRGAYTSLGRDLNVARDAIIAIPGEVMDSQSAQGAAKAVLKRAPTIIFRPAIGVTKAMGKTLIGATNTLDPRSRSRAEQKYKTHQV